MNYAQFLGYTAYWDKMSLGHNPYPYPSKSYEEWKKGWEKASKEDVAKGANLNHLYYWVEQE